MRSTTSAPSMAFKRSAVRSRLSPPTKRTFRPSVLSFPSPKGTPSHRPQDDISLTPRHEYHCRRAAISHGANAPYITAPPPPTCGSPCLPLTREVDFAKQKTCVTLQIFDLASGTYASERSESLRERYRRCRPAAASY